LPGWANTPGARDNELCNQRSDDAVEPAQDGCGRSGPVLGRCQESVAAHHVDDLRVSGSPGDRLRDGTGAYHGDGLIGVALGVGGLADSCTGARVQSCLPDLLIRRLVGILVITIGARYLWSDLG
jgi:hypothetical protein